MGDIRFRSWCVVAVSCLAIAGCGSGDNSKVTAATSATSAPAATATAPPATATSVATPGPAASCVPVADPLPPGAPAVPVDVGPPPAALVTRDLVPGPGAVVAAGATVTVNYIGVACSTGKIFDSSYSRGQPATFPLSNVIKGWQDGIPGMKVGGRRLLGIPPLLAYGVRGSPPAIGPNETLWFVVEVTATR